MTASAPRPMFDQPSIAAGKLELLRQHFPDALETGADGKLRINAHKLQLAFDPAAALVEEDGYELRWAGKREAYHSAFVPPEKIVQPLPDESKNWDSTGNLLIKGDNLDALRLLRQSYFGKVKLVYIDPPYNTQSDAFIYRDDFSARQSEVLKILGYKAEEAEYIKNIYGARTHSGWLSFMYPRLLLARDLLRDDGVIFISIDDNEQAQLKLLCDEVFGQENFVANALWQKKYSVSNDDPGIGVMHDHILVYKKTDFFERNLLPRTELQNARYTNPDNDPRGDWTSGEYVSSKSKTERPTLWYAIKHPKTGEDIWPEEHAVWRYSYEKHLEMESEGRLHWGNNYSYKRPRLKRYLSEVQQGIVPSTWWIFDDCGHNDEAQKETSELLDSKIFSTPKPIRLLKRVLHLGCGKDDLVMDFFAGSGTTAEAVMRLNAEDGGQRQFILVQIPDKIEPRKQKEAHSFVTQTLGKPEATIFEITAERIRRAGAKINADKPEVDTGFRVFALETDPDALILQKPLAEASQADLLELQQRITAPQPAQLPRVLYNLLLAEGLPLSAPIHTVQEGVLYRAEDVLFVLQGMPVADLGEVIRQARAEGQPVQAVSVFAPWVNDDNFLLGLKTLLETLDMSADKLRLRG
ncbi:MAG: site-specific DNA-methyltransferase [Brachymonas sp.]|nr:site-specific DNA-methyltransferase [Brachymonas sp.]